MICECGSKLFNRRTYCRGWWVELIDADGDTVGTDLDYLKYNKAQRLTCVECGKKQETPDES